MKIQKLNKELELETLAVVLALGLLYLWQRCCLDITFKANLLLIYFSMENGRKYVYN